MTANQYTDGAIQAWLIDSQLGTITWREGSSMVALHPTGLVERWTLIGNTWFRVDKACPARKEA